MARRRAHQATPGRTRPRAALAGLALALALGAACDVAPRDGEGARRPNVLLVTLDTTRADHLGPYGYERNTTPRLDAFARDALVVRRAYSTSSWTLPAHASLFTGRYVASHGARYDPEGPLVLSEGLEGRKGLRHYRARGLAPGTRTLARVLRDAGWATGGFVAGPWMKRVFGLDAGFEHWDDSGITEINGRRADALTDAALGWLEDHREEPFLLFLNYFDPHSPFHPPKRYRRAFFSQGNGRGRAQWTQKERQRALYDAEIRFADYHLGRLLDRMEALGLLDESWVVVTADHGELLGEAGRWGHGKSLYEGEIRVPLILRGPEGPPEGVDAQSPLQLVDLMPLLLDRLGLPEPEGVQGAPSPANAHPTVAELHPLPFLAPGGAQRAIVAGRWKLVWRADGAHQLFDLVADPGERSDRLVARPERAAELRERLEAFVAGLPEPPEPTGSERRVDPETERALDSLGYIE